MQTMSMTQTNGISNSSSSSGSTLVLVHALFRHGERTTDERTLYPKDPHINVKYEPYGFGQLTNEGKRTMYELGSILRQRYSKFLDENYYPGLIDAWSSDIDRTKASLQLVLASLFKPTTKHVWNDELLWQPIPTHYIPLNQDDMFLPLVSKKFRTVYVENHKVSQKAKVVFRKYRDVFQMLRIFTGAEVKTALDVFRIHDVLTTESQFGLELPEWAKPLHKGPLREIATLDAEMQMDTKELRQLATGRMIGKIAADTERRIQNGTKFKLHLYSGHDVTVSNILIALGLRYPHLPNYGACILMEIHRIDDEHVLKVFYREHKNQEFKPLLFSDGDFLEFEAFKNLANDLRPPTE